MPVSMEDPRFSIKGGEVDFLGVRLVLELPSISVFEKRSGDMLVLLVAFRNPNRKTEMAECNATSFDDYGPSDEVLPNSTEQTLGFRFPTDIFETKDTYTENLGGSDVNEENLQWPREEATKPIKLLFDRGKSSCNEPLTPEDIDETLKILRAFLIKRCVTGVDNECKKSQISDQQNDSCGKTKLGCKLRCPSSVSQEAYEKGKILPQPSNSGNNESEGYGQRKNKPIALVGDLITVKGASEHVHENRLSDEVRKTRGRTEHDVEMKLERNNEEFKRLMHNKALQLDTQKRRMEEMREENCSLKEQLKFLQIEYLETLAELGRMMVERTAEEKRNQQSKFFKGSFQSSDTIRGYGTLRVSRNRYESITSENAHSKQQAVHRAEALVGTSHYEEGKGKEEMLTNVEDESKIREEEGHSLYKSTLKNLEKDKKHKGKDNQSGKTMKETRSTSKDESENERSTQPNCKDTNAPFSVQQDYQTDYISLKNQPLTSVGTTLYNNYKLLLLTVAERLLSSEAEQLKVWAIQNFSIDTSQKVIDVLFQLDRKEIINASDLSRLKDFFESIVRFDLVYIIDAFLLGDYDVLRYNPRKPEVEESREQKLRQRARSDYTSSLNGASYHSDNSQTHQNPEALRRSENNDEVKTPIPHLRRQTPFPSFLANQLTTNNKHMSTYPDENPSSGKYGHESYKLHSKRLPDTATTAVVAADGTVTRDSRLKTSNLSTSAKSSVNQRRRIQTVGSNGFKLSKPCQPDTIQSNSRNPRNQAPDDEQEVEGNWLCNHYKRRCFVKFECCDKFWPCHRCHNNQSTCGRKKLKSRDTKKLKCANCSKVQEFGQYCHDCNAKFAKYYCGLCKHLTGTDDHPYHCDKCGICRIHGNRSFHCDICGVCLDVQLRGNHKCREGSAHDECCICLEDAFTGCQILPCSHKVHKECATQMIRSGIRRCPICRESFAHKLERRPLSNPKNRSGK